ncbi:guanine nucleotide-binding protein subunit gamma 3-like isoform X1 [Salvia miltiorrhiza]|uniref:guanine nucleotide-binding protein subunit gamma 3-like isoform X1 n=1 Tax=Salvia miltiorrhiza TaxID=226208 RepID=UPI0025ABDFD3|nr:guanine nucleotide-binding protein subunit gamma 3-like isoform X1 [Salvia miltiorrhiza]XP_057806635.1 guanine nucleotide-binding protein subunit gamma 3-like isoform X1 [Salvia miltiorrhiza]XP_057806636.1 guanine nucleotide-binding protein subunit gamma 3-like isoform X1 [Salvia miltiorrhiza]
MSGLKRNGSVPSLPPPQARSPPQYPDLYGKRRELARVQMLEREIGFLDEELKSLESIPPASRSCKEVADFVTGNVDPLIPTIKKTRRSCRFWKWLCGACCFDVSWICCCGCSWDLRMPRCSDCMTCNSCGNPCRNCRIPACQCFPCCSSKCFKKWKCSLKWCCCCMPKRSSCPTCSCPRCTCYPKCPNLNICSCCQKSCCCFPCYYCM